MITTAQNTLSKLSWIYVTLLSCQSISSHNILHTFQYQIKYLIINLLVDIYKYISVHLTIPLFLSVSPSTHLSISLYICCHMPVRPSVYQCVCLCSLSVCPFIHPFLRRSTCLCPSVFIYVFLVGWRMYDHQPVRFYSPQSDYYVSGGTNTATILSSSDC